MDLHRWAFELAAFQAEHGGEGGVVNESTTVIEEMGDGTGAVMIDGKMEDDASVKQCHVMVDLAKQLSARDPELAARYGFAPAGSEA